MQGPFINRLDRHADEAMRGTCTRNNCTIPSTWKSQSTKSSSHKEIALLRRASLVQLSCLSSFLVFPVFLVFYPQHNSGVHSQSRLSGFKPHSLLRGSKSDLQQDGWYLTCACLLPVDEVFHSKVLRVLSRRSASTEVRLPRSDCSISSALLQLRLQPCGQYNSSLCFRQSSFSVHCRQLGHGRRRSAI